MKTLSEQFSAALKGGLREAHITQAELSKRSGISKSQINDILKGRAYGSEETKRSLAAALGYPDRRYEDFLDIGRRILAGEDPEPSPVPAVMKEPAPPPEASGESGNLQEKLAGCLKEIEELKQELETIRKRNDKLIDGLLAKDDRLKGLIAKREELGGELLVRDAQIQKKDDIISTLLNYITENGFDQGLSEEFLAICAESIKKVNAAHKEHYTDHE